MVDGCDLCERRADEIRRAMAEVGRLERENDRLRGDAERAPLLRLENDQLRRRVARLELTAARLEMELANRDAAEAAA